MDKLIEKVLAWGVEKGITGPEGKGTPIKQARKMREEARETIDAVTDYALIAPDTINDLELADKMMEEIKDGIGDVCVTIILLAEMHRLTLDECLQAAYDVISKRTGRMVDGTFVKDKEVSV